MPVLHSPLDIVDQKAPVSVGSAPIRVRDPGGMSVFTSHARGPALAMDMDDADDELRAPSELNDADDPLNLPDRFEIFMPAVQSLVNALGGYEEITAPNGSFQTIYRPGDSVLAVLKDLKRLWRKDDSDDERTVARCMARAGLMKELIALVVECSDRGDWGRKVGLVACKWPSSKLCAPPLLAMQMRIERN